MSKSELFLWKFYWDCGRSGDVEGLFVASQEQVDNAIGQQVWFGEILGKHSEVYGTLEEGDIVKIDVSSEVIAQLTPHLGMDWSGYNPLDYLEEEED